MEPEKKAPNVVVETYSDDVARVIENDREGLVKKIIHGAEEAEKEKQELSPESKINKVYLMSSIGLMVIGLGILGYFLMSKVASTVPVEQQFAPLIFNDKLSYSEISGIKKEGVEQIVLNQVNNSKVKKSGVEGFYLTLNKQLVDLRQFLTLMQSNFVPNESTELVSDNFLLGVVNVADKEEGKNRPGFFMLVKVRSVADVFDSVRAWERKMFIDLHGFIGIPLSSDTTYLLTKDFEDGIVGNKNARLLYDKDGNLVLLYIYADGNSLVVTNSKDAVREIVLRLASKQVKE